jgi:hypothetical protein
MTKDEISALLDLADLAKYENDAAIELAAALKIRIEFREDGGVQSGWGSGMYFVSKSPIVGVFGNFRLAIIRAAESILKDMS